MKRILGKKSKPFALLATVLIIATIGTGSTLAWLMTSSEKVENGFVVPEVAPTILEDFKDGGSVKSNVRVENTVGTGKTGIDVLIRVALVPTWQDVNGNIIPESATVADNLAFQLNTDAWFESGGYYYHKAKVTPSGTTAILAQTIRPIGGPEGARMNLQVLAEAVQATKPAVEDLIAKGAWPAEVLKKLQFE